jgi:D-alanine-D-alanine ligase
MLTTLGVPFVGSGVLASAVGTDKAVAKHVFAAAGLVVADGVVLSHGETGLSESDGDRLGLPVFVKPARAGSSQGVTKETRWEDLGAAIGAARELDPKVLVETALTGREIDIAVLEHPDGRIEAGPPLEVRYGAGEDHFSYHAKYADAETAFDVPARLDDEVAGRLQALAVEVFELLGCSGLLRVDFFWDEELGVPVINEVNTFPGFTAASQFPRIWAAAGLDYPALVDILVATAVRQPAYG